MSGTLYTLWIEKTFHTSFITTYYTRSHIRNKKNKDSYADLNITYKLKVIPSKRRSKKAHNKLFSMLKFLERY